MSKHDEEYEVIDAGRYEVNDIVAAGYVDLEEREYTVHPVYMQPSCSDWNGFPGSIGSAWITIGYRLVRRKKGTEHWRLDDRPMASSIRELILALAEDLNVPDRVLLHQAARDVRASIRLDEQKNPPQPEPKDADQDTPEEKEAP